MADASQPAAWRRPAAAARLLAAGLSLYALYWVVAIVPPHVYRVSFVLVSLILAFLLFPAFRAAVAGAPPFGRAAASAVDAILILAVLVAFGWPLVDADRFVYRAAAPTAVDLACGVLAVLLLLEAARRALGWV